MMLSFNRRLRLARPQLDAA